MENKYFLSRRKFLKSSMVLAGAPLVARAQISGGAAVNATAAPLYWLEKGSKHSASGLTWGVPWPKGKIKAGQAFHLEDKQARKYALQTWPLAYWPDGTLKWTAHAIAAELPTGQSYTVLPGAVNFPIRMSVTEGATEISIHTGSMHCVIPRSGNTVIKKLAINNSMVAENGRLLMLLQDKPDGDFTPGLQQNKLLGEITEVVVEQNGPVKAVIKISGIHTGSELKLMPFVIRLYFYAGSDEIKIIHTLIYNADEERQFIKGIGLTLEVPLKDELHNRHIRFVNSEGNGLFGEAVRGLTGLRRNPGAEITTAQVNGKATPPLDQFPPEIKNYLKYIPAFGDYTLFQSNASGFTIRKRTTAAHSWVSAAAGKRAGGAVYLGTPNGGLVAGIRHFWQSFPAQLDIRDAATDTGKISLWLWAPEAAAMDLRFYHDGMGEDTYEKQREGLEITYEDYEPRFGKPQGVARTSEIVLKPVSATPVREEIIQIAMDIEAPPRLICDHNYLEQQKVFGGNWTVEDRSNPARAALEQQLESYFTYYQKQVDYHNWYGYWNYGDFMHTYDADRHTWRYDVGGFGWDNSELSTDLWLWYYYLKTQRTDVFHTAEAMTRHTGEVDVHHTGRFAPLGSRHNVMHWGDSAKQLRISTAANRRFYYYLTADERVGDLLREQVDAARTLSRIQPNRKLEGIRDEPQPAYTESSIPAGFGTDYGAIAAAWLTEWERTGDVHIKQRLINSMTTIAAQPHGFFTGTGILHPDTGKFDITTSKAFSVSHLNAVFGLTEIVEELLLLLDVPAFANAWLQYCRLYNAPAEEQEKELGQSFNKLNLGQGHARLTAYAAYVTKDAKLAARAWKEFYSGKAGIVPGHIQVQPVKGPWVLNPVEEDVKVSTNAVAQWGLAAIQCLAYIGKDVPHTNG